jgi:hypothetical protein
LATLEEQQGYFYVCIDIDLEGRIKPRISPTTPIFGEDSCVSLLEEEFNSKYPLFARRLDFFKYTQARGQAFSDYVAKLQAKGNESDLHQLGVEDLYVFKFLNGCSDPKLKEEFMRLKDPKLQDLIICL